MTTDKQKQTNGQNALLSTGPKTTEGKVIVSKNAVKHGIFARDLIISSGDGQENEDEYFNLLEDLRRDLMPINRVEMLLVEKIAVNYWRLRRLVKYETGEIRNQLDDYKEAALRSHYSGTYRSIERPELRLYNYNDMITDDEYQQQFQRVLNLHKQKNGILESKDTLEYVLYFRLDYEDPVLTEEDYAAARNYISNLSPQLKGKLRKEMLEDAEEILGEMEEVRTWRTKFDRIEKAKSLPSGHNIDNIIKYENSLERSIFKNLGALKALQENRSNNAYPEEAAEVSSC